MLGNLFEPCRPALGEHIVRLRDPQLLLFSLRFHDFVVMVYAIIDAKSVSFVIEIKETHIVTKMALNVITNNALMR